MNCKVEYIEQAYRTVHSEFADVLTNAHHSIFNRVKQWNNENPKASFTRKESDDSKVRFTFATNGSTAQKKQAKFVQQLNRENPSNNDVPVVHSVGRELRVNVLRGTNSYWKKMFEGKQFQKLTEEEKNQTISEAAKKAGSVNALHDLAARLADRIGGEVKFENRRDVDYKGYSQGNKAVINEAYADTSTVVHEILGHPIINAIRNVNDETEQFFSGKVENVQTLYKNLLKELESGKGKEVLERVKRDYVYKENKNYEITQQDGKWWVARNEGYDSFDLIGEYNSEKEAKESLPKYTLEEQQEEAIVELLGMYTANKLDAIKDKGLIALLKQLLKEMTTYLRSLFNSKEIEIEKLDASMTLDDLANLLAYTNSKMILPNSTIKYTTPDNQQFKTYVEASKHISDLIKNVEDVDLDSISLKTAKTIEEVPDSFSSSIILNSKDKLILDSEGIPDIITDYDYQPLKIKKVENNWYVSEEYDYDYVMYLYDTDPNVKETLKHGILIPEEKVIELFNERFKNSEFGRFIAKNKEYEQSKEIIEEWKKVNNIVYNPDEVYSRGQGFYSVVGAYSNFEVKLMFQNLLQHIEDNEKAGGEFTISAFTKPVDKTISHLEGGGGKIKFVIYPKSEDIKWATDKDAYSGSVWDAGEKVNKNKKSELLGVSYTKYPSLDNLNSVQPNLASIIYDLSDHHNELGISLNSNFRIEYDENIPYSTKKILNSINSILDGKYGKLEKPEFRNKTVPPTTTNSTLKESIDSVKERLPTKTDTRLAEDAIIDISKIPKEFESKTLTGADSIIRFENNKWLAIADGSVLIKELNEAQVLKAYNKFIGKTYKKEYTSQALINTKIAALKEAAKKYPRSLIRSEVVAISDNSNIQYQKQSPSLTTEQTTQIEELKQSDVRWNISSNFVRNVNELGEQFEESPYESYINDKGKITNIRYPIFRDISKIFGTSAKNLQRSARILWKEKDSGNSRGNSEWKNSWLFNDPFLKENEQFTAKEIWEKYQITQDERYTALLGYFFADRLLEKGNDFVGKLFQRGYIVLSSEERPFAADASQLHITRAGIKSVLNLTSTYEDFEKAIEVILTEEAIHHTIDKLITDEEVDAIYNELSQEEIDRIKKMYDKPNLSNFLVVHEYLRMIVQRKHLGFTSESELYRKILNIVHRLVEYLKDMFKNNPTANIVINRFDEFLKTPYAGGIKELSLISKLMQQNNTTSYPITVEAFAPENGEDNIQCFI